MDAIRDSVSRLVRATIFGVFGFMVVLTVMPLLPHWLITAVVVGAIGCWQRERVLDGLSWSVRRYDDWRADRATLAGDVTPSPIPDDVRQPEPTPAPESTPEPAPPSECHCAASADDELAELEADMADAMAPHLESAYLAGYAHGRGLTGDASVY